MSETGVDDGAGDSIDSDESPEATYGGLLGAIPYAFRASDSSLLRSYVVVGILLALLVTALFVQALVVLLGGTVGTSGGTFTFSRAFFVVVALAIVVPLLAPIISTARRHRRGYGDRRTDGWIGALGYLFVGALYLGLVVSAPPELRESVEGPLAPVVEALYALPWPVAILPPTLVAIAMYVVHRRARP